MARKSGQDFFEIKLSKPLLFSGKQGGLRATTPDETELPTFQTYGFDLVNASREGGQPPEIIMQRCVSCHSGGGIRSTSPNKLQP